MGRTIDLDAAIDALHMRFSDGFVEDRWWNSTHVLDVLRSVPSAHAEKCSDILDELKADDYYNYIHTGYSRFSEDDWDYLIHNAKEKEKLHERLDKQAGGD